MSGGRRIVSARMPTVGRVPRLPSHVRRRRRIVAHQHHGQPRLDARRAQALDVAPHLVAHLLRDRVAVDDRGGHACSPVARACCGSRSVATSNRLRRNRAIAAGTIATWSTPSASTSSRSRVCASVLGAPPGALPPRVYTPEEVAFCRGRVPELAARFAAKEAVMKALGTGARGLAWREIEILPNRRGKPLVYLHGKAARARRDDRAARRRHQPHALARAGDRRRRRRGRRRADRPRRATAHASSSG